MEHSWSVGVGRQSGQYIYIVQARLSAHTDWSAEFNWRRSPLLSHSIYKLITLCTLHSTVHCTLPSTLFTVHCTLYSVMYIVYCTYSNCALFCFLHCMLHSWYLLFIIHCTYVHRNLSFISSAEDITFLTIFDQSLCTYQRSYLCNGCYYTICFCIPDFPMQIII